MSNARNTGGAPWHQPARDTVDRPAHDVPQSQGNTTPREAKLEDPGTPHSSPSAREERRAREREAKREARHQEEPDAGTSES